MKSTLMVTVCGLLFLGSSLMAQEQKDLTENLKATIEGPLAGE